MVLSYQLTEDDYREAFLQVQRSAARRRLLRRATGPVTKYGPAAALIVAYVLLSKLLPTLESPDRFFSPLARSADVILPFIAISLAFVPLNILLTISPRVPNWRAIGGALFAFLSASAVCVLLYFASPLTPGRAAAGPEPIGPAVAPHLGWFALTAIAAAMAARSQRLGARLGWSGQQHLHLPHTLDATVTGVTLSTANCRYDYPWQAIPAFAETPNTFLLHVADLAFHIVPKRAFASADEQAAFRHMLQNLTAPSTAFPVLPAATPGR